MYVVTDLSSNAVTTAALTDFNDAGDCSTKEESLALCVDTRLPKTTHLAIKPALFLLRFFQAFCISGVMTTPRDLNF